GPIDAEPEMQHEYDCKRTDEAHAEPEDQRDRESELGEKDDGIQNMKVWKIDFGDEVTMKCECGTAAHLLGPVFQAAGDRQRQLPEHALKPHSPDEHAHEPGAELRARAL